MSNIDEILLKQKQYFLSGETFDLNFRIQSLKKLRETLNKYEGEICSALKADLNKSDFESFMCEIGLARSEITYLIKNVKKLAKPKKVKTPLAQFCSKTYKLPTPLGNTLIMSPWNYPFLLSIDPLADAISAGNTVVLKPSAYSPSVSAIIAKIVGECFDEKHVAVVLGGRKENSELLDKKFDFIFFTGSQAVGKEVLKRASENLTPCVLELGGKSPCIVDETANLALTAKHVVFGKFLNCGQTCVAPDFIFCHKSVKDDLIEEIKKQIVIQYGENALENPDYGKIVNRKHFDRILSLIDGNKTVIGGFYNEKTCQIAPTVTDNVTFSDAVMQEEIFGPLLPVLTYEKENEIYELTDKLGKPLAFYYFGENKKRAKEIISRARFGGGCVNDTVIHLATSETGFGGVGESGMGSYHGADGFNAFSHVKSIVDKKTWIDLPMRYQPYNRKLFSKLIRFFLK